MDFLAAVVGGSEMPSSIAREVRDAPVYGTPLWFGEDGVDRGWGGDGLMSPSTESLVTSGERVDVFDFSRVV